MEKLTALFEEHGLGPAWLDGCVEGFDGEFSRATIAKELKRMGLQRGKLTDSQVRAVSLIFDWCIFTARSTR